jgi:ATP-dependent exoDNAse (exonuclease V) alpha subunit
MKQVKQAMNQPEVEASIELMAEGNFHDALARYDTKGGIKWTRTQEEALSALVRKWAADTKADPSKTRFVFAYTNDDVSEINFAIRHVRRERGELGEDHKFATKRGQEAYATGDRIQIIGTDKERGPLNGHAGTITKIKGSTIHLQLDGRARQVIAFDAKEFKEFRHGYAGTIYKGQCRTLDQTYLYHSEHWRSAASYVALTRHRDKAEVFVARNTAPNLKELARQMARVDNRKAASHYYPADGAQSGDAASQSASHSREPKVDDPPKAQDMKPGRNRLAAALAEARRSATTRDSLPEGHAETGETSKEDTGKSRGRDRGGGRSL